MGNPFEIVQFYYIAVNLIAAAGFISVAAAIALSIHRKLNRFPLVFIPLAVALAAAGLSMAIKALTHGTLPDWPELIFNTLAALGSAVTGAVIWPVLLKISGQPTYNQIESTNQQLQYYKRLFESFMEHSPAAAFLKDAQGKLVYVNRAFRDEFGVHGMDKIGATDSERLPPELLNAVSAHDQEVITTGKSVSEVVFLARPDSDETEPWLVVKFPVSESESGATIGGIAISVAEKYRVDQLRSEMAAIVASSQDAIIGQTLDGIITSWNQGAEELFGYASGEVLGKPISILVPSDRRNEVPELLKKLKRGVRVGAYNSVVVSRHGDLKDVSFAVSPVRDAQGAVVGAAAIVRDISLLRRSQDEIQQLNKQLKDRVYELAEANAALQAARDQALEASSLKSAFVANISHELRTPLSGILGLNEMLLQSKKLKGEDLKLSQMVQESAEALLNVVNDILDLSKIEAGKVTLEYAPLNLTMLLQDCTKLMAASARNSGLAYELSMDQNLPDMVYGDASRLRQILLNLIGNAVKFTEKGSVTVRARAVSLTDDDATVEFSVEDSGIGISPEDQRYLFMPFAQVDNSSTRRFGGTGLGLTISKRFVEMMGGEVGLISEKRVGSTFWFRVKFDRKKLHAPQEFSTERLVKPGEEAVPSDLAQGRKILLVEDNAVLQHLALRQLHTLGVHAEATVFGRDAIEMAMSDTYDLILMDINLPDISGLEATAAIRNLEHSARRPAIPIIAMTAGAMQDDRDRAVAAGMDDYLSKPVAIDKLKDVVETWLRKSQIHMYRRAAIDMRPFEQPEPTEQSHHLLRERLDRVGADSSPARAAETLSSPTESAETKQREANPREQAEAPHKPQPEPNWIW